MMKEKKFTNPEGEFTPMKQFRMFLAIILIVVCTFTGCAKPTDQFQQYVKDGDYMEALKVYSEKVVGNTGDEAVCRAFLDQYAEENLTAFANGSATETELEACLDMLTKLDEYLYIVENLNDLYWQYEDLKMSKAEYAMGTEYEADGLLEEAIWAFSSVLPEDLENFEHAQANIDRLMAQITSNFEASIRDAQTSGDPTALFDAYLQGLENPYVNISSEISLLYETTVADYLAKVYAQAEEAFGGEAKDYNAALTVVQNALSQVNFVPELLSPLEELVREYVSYVPFPLTDLEYVQRAEYIAVGNARDKNATDINGGYHEPDNVISSKGGSLNTDYADTEDEAYVLYNLNYQYSTLTGVVFRPYSFLSYSNEESKPITVRIYGDDVLLFEMRSFNENSDSVPFQLDVSAVRNLKIVVAGVWRESSGWIGIYDYHPRVCVGDLMLQR